MRTHEHDAAQVPSRTESGGAGGRLRRLALRIAREPLAHFLVAGALLFAAHAWLNPQGRSTQGTIHIALAEVNWLKETWSRQWQRPPTETELRGLLREYLKEALLAREAIEMGLDADDTVVRRRLAQKLEFLLQDTARIEAPAESDLRAFHAGHLANYRSPERISFQQVQFDTREAADAALAGLAAGEPEPSGDLDVLKRDHADADPLAVRAQFGGEFAHAVFQLGTGNWQGPLESSYGYHLVRVDARQAAQPRPFEEVRGEVLADWTRSQQETAVLRFHQDLLAKYDVVADEGVRHLLAMPAGGQP